MDDRRLPLDVAEKIELHAARLLRLTLIGAAALALYGGRWTLALITLLILGLTFLPLLFQRQTRIRLPLDFEFVVILLLYASLFLGEVGDYYVRFWWWDLMLHGFSSVAVGYAGFLILYILHAENRLGARPFWIALFSFCFALAAGVLWEIFEFAMDRLLGTNMQKSGLLDTMGDLMVNAVGALFASFVGYLYLRGKSIGPFRRLMRHFVSRNPELFEGAWATKKRREAPLFGH